MKAIYQILKSPSLSPAGFLVWTCAIVALFGVTHALGWRENATILTGTVPGDESPGAASLKAMAHMAAYFGATLVAPVFALASGIMVLLQRRLGSGRRPAQAAAGAEKDP
ncbi:MAG: hypothetical protein HYR88_04600 [Verrucomicrobia bacterium]|nr:hypothetical protein [Verrucomicrobiota bacterium]MBI3867079.1 hypothetical protein [Verrucomicrobiota bacterium]